MNEHSLRIENWELRIARLIGGESNGRGALSPIAQCPILNSQFSILPLP